MHDLDGSLGLTPTFPFVGRSAELKLLRTLMPRAAGEGIFGPISGSRGDTA